MLRIQSQFLESLELLLDGLLDAGMQILILYPYFENLLSSHSSSRFAHA